MGLVLVWLLIVVLVYILSRLRWVHYDIRRLRMDLDQLQREVERMRQ